MEIRLKDYLTGGASAVAALNQACMKMQDGDTLLLGGGRIDVYAEDAFTRHYYISNNDAGDKAIAFPLIGKNNIIIDGENADIIFHGGIMPFAVDHCSNVKICNLSIDYDQPMFSQAEIQDADSERVVLRFDGEEFCCKVRDDHLVFFSSGSEIEIEKECALCLEFDKDTKAPTAYLANYFYYSGEEKDHGFLSYMYKDVVLKELGENLIEMKGKFGQSHTPGNMWVCTYAGRDYPGFFVTESKNVFIKNVTMYQTQAMGVICQLSENITIDHVKADMRQGSQRLLTTGADATHFVNCRGNIEIKDCKFINMMDDACNIHGIYLKDPKQESDYSIMTTYGHEQQKGLNIFRPGDIVHIINVETLEVVFASEVVESRQMEEDTLCIITKEPVPVIPDHCVAENISTAPNVHICGTETGNNRPRGFLLSSSGKILVENCKFYNMTQGINLGGEMLNWYESGAVTDVTIRNNEFHNSAYAGGVAIGIVPKIKHRESAGSFHKRVNIENNHFTMHERRLLRASNVGELRFVGNTFTCDESLPAQQAENERGILTEYCEKEIIEWV